jgi:hypothetical protein
MQSNPPTRAVAGDTWRWSWSSAAYPASAGWQAAWRLIGPGIALDISSSAQGDAHLAEAPASATAALAVPPSGVSCTLVGWVTNGDERYEIYRAPLSLLPNPATSSGDLRGRAAQLLDAIDAMLAGRATKDQESYRIGDRELRRIPIPDLIALRDWAASQARAEAAAEALMQGRPRSRRIVTRMARG